MEPRKKLKKITKNIDVSTPEKELKLSQVDKFDWNVDLSSFQSIPDVQVTRGNKNDKKEKSNEVKKRKLTKFEKKKLEKENEEKIQEVERKLLELESNPQSPEQFDRLLLGQPNNSQLWIKYMAYFLQASEFGKAKAVARRALETIDMRQEQEKLNIWVALLNLENLFGTKESQKECLEEALRMNDDYKIYSKMMNIYVATKKNRELEEIINRMSRKFRDSMDCWLQCAEALFTTEEHKKARFILQRALTSLPKKEHVTMISRFALLENRMGFSEEAIKLFEQVLTCYPQRTDVCSCYIDMLVKSGKILVARQVLATCCTQKLPPRKMKFLYTKWLSFEQKYGNEHYVKQVRQKAAEYVNASESIE